MRTQKDREDEEKDEKPFSTKAADEKDTDDEEKAAAPAPTPLPGTPVPPKDLTQVQMKVLLAEIRQIAIDHVTRLGGVGAALGPIGDRIMLWLQKYDLWTHPTQLPADDRDLEGLPKDERERITKERKALREKAAKEAQERRENPEKFEHKEAHILPAKEPKEHEKDAPFPRVH